MRRAIGLFILAYRYRKIISFVQFLKLELLQLFQRKGKLIKVYLKNSHYPFYIRANTSDYTIFRHIFLIEEYPKLDFDDEETIYLIDAGANIGAATFYYKIKYPKAKVIVIEPDKTNFEMLKLNLSPFSDILFENASLHNISGLNLCIENPTAGNMGFRLKESVEKGLISTSIDSLLVKYHWDKIDLVKIDIEGSEEQVFSSQFNWLACTRNLVIELHDHYAPMASTNLIRALSNFEIELKWQGENLICKFK